MYDPLRRRLNDSKCAFVMKKLFNIGILLRLAKMSRKHNAELLFVHNLRKCRSILAKFCA